MLQVKTAVHISVRLITSSGRRAADAAESLIGRDMADVEIAAVMQNQVWILVDRELSLNSTTRDFVSLSLYK